MALNHDNRIPPFPATTLSTNQFRWLEEGDWDNAEREYFLADRRALGSGIFAAPPVFREKSKPHLQRVGRWILNPFPNDSTAKVGWGEVQLLTGTFRTGFIILGRPGNGAFPIWDAWSLLISASFVQWNLDMLRIVPAHMPLSTLASLGGQSKSLWTPRTLRPGNLDEGLSPLVSVQVLEWTQRAWWESERGRKDRATVSYLVRRRSKYEEEHRCQCSSKS